jgi:hypothetical protein
MRRRSTYCRPELVWRFHARAVSASTASRSPRHVLRGRQPHWLHELIGNAYARFGAPRARERPTPRARARSAYASRCICSSPRILRQASGTGRATAARIRIRRPGQIPNQRPGDLRGAGERGARLERHKQGPSQPHSPQRSREIRRRADGSEPSALGQPRSAASTVEMNARMEGRASSCVSLRPVSRRLR